MKEVLNGLSVPLNSILQIREFNTRGRAIRNGFFFGGGVQLLYKCVRNRDEEDLRDATTCLSLKLSLKEEREGKGLLECKYRKKGRDQKPVPPKKLAVEVLAGLPSDPVAKFAPMSQFSHSF